MNQILLNVLATVVTCIILPLISFLGVKLTQWLNTKIKDEKGQALIGQAVDIVLNAVRSVFQTYVESRILEGKDAALRDPSNHESGEEGYMTMRGIYGSYVTIPEEWFDE